MTKTFYFIIGLILSAACDPPLITCDEAAQKVSDGWSCANPNSIGKGASAIAYIVKKGSLLGVCKVQSIKEKGLEDKAKIELDILQHVNNENVVKLYAYAEDRFSILSKRNMYTVLEYAANKDLYKYLLNNPELSENSRQVMKIFLQILKGIKAVHEYGYLHTDIKTGNIVLDQNMNAKIIDFDMACKPGKISGLRGTPTNMDPRHLVDRNYDYDAFTDVYSLGTVLYELFHRADVPFDGLDMVMITQRLNRGIYSIRQGVEVTGAYIIQNTLLRDAKSRLTIDKMIELTQKYLNDPVSHYIKRTTTDTKYPIQLDQFEIQSSVTDGPKIEEKTLENQGATANPLGKNTGIDTRYQPSGQTNVQNTEANMPKFPLRLKKPIFEGENKKIAQDPAFWNKALINTDQNKNPTDEKIPKEPTQPSDKSDPKKNWIWDPKTNEYLNPDIYNPDGTIMSLEQMMQQIDNNVKRKKEEAALRLNPVPKEQYKQPFVQDSAQVPHQNFEKKEFQQGVTKNLIFGEPKPLYEKAKYGIPTKFDFDKNGNVVKIGLPAQNQQDIHSNAYQTKENYAKYKHHRNLGLSEEAVKPEVGLDIDLNRATVIEERDKKTSIIMLSLFLFFVAMCVPVGIVLRKRSNAKAVSDAPVKAEVQAENKPEGVSDSLHIEVA